jgi:hypothetical protein
MSQAKLGDFGELEEGNEIQLCVEVADDGSGVCMSQSVDARRAYLRTHERNSYKHCSHIVMVPLTETEQEGWGDRTSEEYMGETCAKVTNVKERYMPYQS